MGLCMLQFFWFFILPRTRMREKKQIAGDDGDNINGTLRKEEEKNGMH